MSRIVVFDSGLGSLSIIRAIQKISKSEIIYFADQKNFPYGGKTKVQLGRIIRNRLAMIDERFRPDVTVVGSNTPTLLLKNLIKKNVIGVTPPLREASKASKSKNIGMLATKSVIQSRELARFLREQNLPKNVRVFKINASLLVDLVESGDFVGNPKKCARTVRKLLGGVIYENKIDAVTLSSTHLPFLKSYFEREFPTVEFVDPARKVAQLVRKKIQKDLDRNRLCIYTSSSPETFQSRLAKIKIYNKVAFLP